MKLWFRRHSVKIYQSIFIFLCIAAVIIIGRGFFSVFKDEIKEFVSGLSEDVAERICYHIYKEENSVFGFYESTTEDEPLLLAMLTGITRIVSNGTSARDDNLVVEVVNETSLPEKNIFDVDIDKYNVMEDETTDDKLHSLEALAVLENSKALNEGLLDGEEEEMLVIEKMEGILPEKIPVGNGPINNSSGEGDSYDEAVQVVSLQNLLKTDYSLEKMKNFNYLLTNYYIVDTSTKATASLFQVENLLNKNLTIKKNNNPDKPQVLIYHTHASETYADSRAGVEEDTVVGPGEYLTQLLTKLGYSVYHDKTAYDKKNGQDNRNYAYSTARPAIEKYLKENPQIEVIIDLHRDSGAKRATMIDGKATAQIMFFNGLCRNANGPIADLENPNLLGNLAFSLQTNLLGRSMYPGLMYKIYLKNYRYNQHFTERYLLIELGTQMNTVEEAYNAMEPLAKILDQVLSNQ